MDIWAYQRRFIRRLMQWALLSLWIGGLFSRGRGFWHASFWHASFWRGVGGQFLGWSALNLGIAYVGARRIKQRQAALDDAASPAAAEREARALTTLLIGGIAFDLLSLAFGRGLLRRGRRGAGIGMTIQALFLLLFDLYHLTQIPAQSPPHASEGDDPDTVS